MLWNVTLKLNYLRILSNKKTNPFCQIIVDARHDYAGLTEDLQKWWPLIRDQGIMAGHDFVDMTENWKQAWNIGPDGVADPLNRCAREAVVDFFSDPTKPDQYRQLYIVYKESGWW